MIKRFNNFINEGHLLQKFKKLDTGIKYEDILEKFEYDPDKISEYFNQKYVGKNIKIENSDGWDETTVLNVKKFIVTKGNVSNKIVVRVYSDNIFILTVKDEDEMIYLYKDDTIYEVEVIEVERRYTENDPYGEEDWMDESKINEGRGHFDLDKIKDPVMIDKIKEWKSKSWSPNCNDIGEIYNYIEKGEWYEVTKDVHKYKKVKKFLVFNRDEYWTDRKTKIIRVDSVYDDWGCYYLGYEYEYVDGKVVKYQDVIYFYDSENVIIRKLTDRGFNFKEQVEKIEAEEQRKRDEMILKHADIDPYGEDNWEEHFEGKLNESDGHKFELGDRVKYVGNSYPGTIYNKNNFGKIVKIYKYTRSQNPVYGVEFDMPIGGHTSANSGRDQYCWNLREDDLELSSDNKEYLDRKEETSIKHRHIDPYGEEDWLVENKKKKKTFNRIRMYEVDPWGEEDWGWDTDIDDSKFKGKYIIYKNHSNDFIFAKLNSHYEIVFMEPSRVSPDGINISLNTIKKHGGIFPISEREIYRIKKNKLLLLPYKGKHRNDYGEVVRYPFSYLKMDDVYFLDQEYMDNYLYMNE